MEHGRVVSVNYDEGVVYCDVEPTRENVVYERVAFVKPHSGFIHVPKQNDTVAMQQLNDGKRFITGVIAREDVMAPPAPLPGELQDGEITIRLDKDTELTFSKTNDGRHNIDIRSSKDLKLRAEENLTIEAGGDIDVSAGGNVTIQGLNFMDHTHGYEDTVINDTSDGSGGTATFTEDTGTPQ